MHSNAQLSSSYRDPSGFMFEKEGILYRQVNFVFKQHFDHFIESGCYTHLSKSRLLVKHQEIDNSFYKDDKGYKILQPDVIPFISYPYEWCFDMLKDAALFTLQLVKECIPFGVMLKDASPYNIQWLHGKLIFIDTLSFEKYNTHLPWIAYRQFCESFLSPLLLMHYTRQPLQPIMLAYPDGIPLPIVANLLPMRSQVSLHTYLHIHMHSRLYKKSGNSKTNPPTFSQTKFERLITSLQTLISSLTCKGNTTVWENYYEEASKRNDYVSVKQQIISQWMNELRQIDTVIDLGSNEGKFSLSANSDVQIISADLDHAAVNNLYNKIKKQGIKNILPLVIDLANPSPAIGVNNLERNSFLERSHYDLGLALALIHHLCIGRNIPFENVAALFSKMVNYLIIEYVPREDEKVQLMLLHKNNIYSFYTEENFVSAFKKSFTIIHRQEISPGGRILFLMIKHAKV